MTWLSGNRKEKRLAVDVADVMYTLHSEAFPRSFQVPATLVVVEALRRDDEQP